MISTGKERTQREPLRYLLFIKVSMFPGKQYLLLQGIETHPLKLVLEIF